MKITNLSENLIITIVVGALCGTIGAVSGYKAAVKSNESTLEQVIPTIEKAIDKETIKNEIKNEIQIDKVKKSDSLTIIMDPTNNQEPTNVITKDCDWLIELLSDREKRKLKRAGHL